VIALTAAAFVAGSAFARRRAVTPMSEPAAPPSDGLSSSASHVLESVGEGILLLDRSLAPLYMNAAARSLLGMEEGPLPGRLPLREATEVAEAASQGREGDVHRSVEIFYPRRLTLDIRATFLPDSRESVVVLRDVTDEVRTQRLRTEFVAHASHELKTPVASLQTLAEATTEALPDDMAAAERFAGRMVMEAGRLAKLIADLLDLSRLEDPTALTQELCNPAAIVKEEIDDLGIVMMESGLSLTSDLDEELLFVGDARQLSLLVRNLLENAIQYTPSGGAIEVSLVENAGRAELTVRDNGAGIPKEALEKIFERFYRVDPGRSRDSGGTGLGLAIVKHIAERHGGTVAVESELDRGSAFTVTLPLAEAQLSEV
jgi:signal transduction histidine kinase